jgi:hypothetical protein
MLPPDWWERFSMTGHIADMGCDAELLMERT